MFTIEIRGRITEDGKLEFNLPPNLPVGDVNITLEILPDREEQVPEEYRPWAEGELEELLHAPGIPKTGAEIVEWLKTQEPLDFDGMTGEEWVEWKRRLQDERAKAKWHERS